MHVSTSLGGTYLMNSTYPMNHSTHLDSHHGRTPRSRNTHLGFWYANAWCKCPWPPSCKRPSRKTCTKSRWGNYRHAQLWGHDNHQQNVGPHGATLVTWTLSSMRVKESPWTRDCPGAHTGPSRLRRSNPPQATFHGGNAPGLREVAATWDDLEAGFAPISSPDKFERSRLHDASVNRGQSRVSVFEKLHYVSLHLRAWGAMNTHTHV